MEENRSFSWTNLFIKITDKFECSLETTNLGDKDFVFSEALHSYFYVSSSVERSFSIILF